MAKKIRGHIIALRICIIICILITPQASIPVKLHRRPYLDNESILLFPDWARAVQLHALRITVVINFHFQLLKVYNNTVKITANAAIPRKMKK